VTYRALALLLALTGCWSEYSFVDGEEAGAPGRPSPDAVATVVQDAGPDQGPVDADVASPDAAGGVDTPLDSAPTSTIQFRLPTVSVMGMGGTAVLDLTVSNLARAGAVTVALVSSSPDVLVPSMVALPEGRSSIAFRVRAAAASGATVLRATLMDGSATTALTTLTLVTSAPAPVPGDLVINEVNYDVPTTNGDASCDGVTSAFGDEFIELSNRSTHPVGLEGVSLWDEFGFTGNKPRFTFPATVLGSGETIVVFGGPLGPGGNAPWCKAFGSAMIGDAVSFANPMGFNLDNAGDTVHITAGPSSSSQPLGDPVVLPAGGNQAWSRFPDFEGPFGRHGDFPDHAPDRRWTPGTRVTGEPFAAVNP